MTTQPYRESVAYKNAVPTTKKVNSNDVLREVKPRRKRKTMTLKPVCTVLCIAAISVTIIYNYMMLTQITDELQTKKTQLAELDSEYVSLKAKQENQFNMNYVEEYAQTKLNMIKMDKNQIEYIELSNPDQIEVSNGSGAIKEKIASFAKSLNAVFEFIK